MDVTDCKHETMKQNKVIRTQCNTRKNITIEHKITWQANLGLLLIKIPIVSAKAPPGEFTQSLHDVSLNYFGVCSVTVDCMLFFFLSLSGVSFVSGTETFLQSLHLQPWLKIIRCRLRSFHVTTAVTHFRGIILIMKRPFDTIECIERVRFVLQSKHQSKEKNVQGFHLGYTAQQGRRRAHGEKGSERSPDLK